MKLTAASFADAGPLSQVCGVDGQINPGGPGCFPSSNDGSIPWIAVKPVHSQKAICNCSFWEPWAAWVPACWNRPSFGHRVTVPTRGASKLTEIEAVDIAVGAPTGATFLRQHIVGQDPVVICLGIDMPGRTTLFSQTTQAVVGAKKAAGIRRLVAVTGVGAGDSKGQGGWLCDHANHPAVEWRSLEMVRDCHRPPPYAVSTG
ncbi:MULTISPECIES: NAD(P)H-binding protein [Paracoccus]|uniref:NAD(P)H-binding protein n=1 Tax=Paracoccus TaxID=265 RepID=UPI001FB61C22|nr:MULTISPECIES: NAD(P)H-binding protein [Paracoccus]MCJ1901139.1 NAD(P)H-binding protein [Paracoccus versutus]MDF3906198.1 NAD(P)H-binding protein [Paracoccus sp. AS002]